MRHSLRGEFLGGFFFTLPCIHDSIHYGELDSPLQHEELAPDHLIADDAGNDPEQGEGIMELYQNQIFLGKRKKYLLCNIGIAGFAPFDFS